MLRRIRYPIRANPTVHIPRVKPLANARRGIIYLHTVRDRINAQRNHVLPAPSTAPGSHRGGSSVAAADPDDNHAQRRRGRALHHPSW